MLNVWCRRPTWHKEFCNFGFVACTNSIVNGRYTSLLEWIALKKDLQTILHFISGGDTNHCTSTCVSLTTMGLKVALETPKEMYEGVNIVE